MRAEPRVYDVLVYLIRNRNRLVSKAELTREVWGGVTVQQSALTRSIYQARKLVGDRACITTLHGKGYRFALSVLSERGAVSSPELRPSL